MGPKAAAFKVGMGVAKCPHPCSKREACSALLGVRCRVGKPSLAACWGLSRSELAWGGRGRAGSGLQGSRHGIGFWQACYLPQEGAHPCLSFPTNLPTWTHPPSVPLQVDSVAPAQVGNGSATASAPRESRRTGQCWVWGWGNLRSGRKGPGSSGEQRGSAQGPGLGNSRKGGLAICLSAHAHLFHGTLAVVLWLQVEKWAQPHLSRLHSLWGMCFHRRRTGGEAQRWSLLRSSRKASRWRQLPS